LRCELADLEEVEAERLDLRQDAVKRQIAGFWRLAWPEQ
jgi:hypothetical protein